MKNPDLSVFTTEQLAVEIAKRKAVTSGKSAKDWYYFIRTEECERFIMIVHKRFWHRHHCVYDSHIKRFLELPQEFFEVQESFFTYEGEGGIRRGKKLLRELGFTELKSFHSARVSHRCEIDGKTCNVGTCCDTPELSALLEPFSLSHREYAERGGMKFADIAAYQAWIEALAPGAVFEIISTYSGGITACLMHKEVAAALPAYPLKNCYMR